MTIGLSVIILIMESAYLINKKPIYQKMAKFWVHVFAIIFAVGVATGLVQVFAFGTNWARFSHFVGDVFGSILGAEAVFAFFLESGFIALLLFGWNRVGPKTHLFATAMVSLAAHFSAIWIVLANSWMQTPAGYQIIGEGASRHAVIESFGAVLNNPSGIDRLWHVIIGSWLAGSFLVISISAYYLLRKRYMDFARKSFKIALIVGSICVLAQAVSGDSTGRTVAREHPIKLAAMEGVFKTETNTPLVLAGYPNVKERKVNGIVFPKLLTFLIYREFGKAVPGLDQFPEELWPPIGPVFQSYHIMLYMWGMMLFACIFGWIAWIRSPTFERKGKWALWFCVFSVLFPEIANQVGWYTAEIGRQPWVVYGIMRTSEGVSSHLLPGQIIFSLILFVLIYILVFTMFIYLLDRTIKKGPYDESAMVDEYRDPYKK
ncbi:MAG: hypothetical protein S4CHLAM45_02740 [Chlamydiales bacterium]|nr:hypothetical protein [Chlamydiales bacterium]MCH9619132.1 hypothetical protein [Chlamydiales bacterium]MCH9622394.1 hypothetical protein [Chlamydiales bacterium]